MTTDERKEGERGSHKGGEEREGEKKREKGSGGEGERKETGFKAQKESRRKKMS